VTFAGSAINVFAHISSKQNQHPTGVHGSVFNSRVKITIIWHNLYENFHSSVRTSQTGIRRVELYRTAAYVCLLAVKL